MTAPRTSLSDTHKEAVKPWVPKVRALLQDDFAAQLRRLGLHRDRPHQPLSEMRLSREDAETRRRMEALLKHDAAAEGAGVRAYDQLLRELTYTLLNRLVGLKCMEARGLLFLPPPGKPDGAPEQTEVLTPVADQQYSRFLRDLRAAGGSRYKYEADAEEALYRDGLKLAFQHITRDIRVLFDPEHPYAALWPSHGALVALIGRINGDLPEEAWRAVDMLGWVYQFFGRDEKRRVREETKGIPRSSYELGIMNQFYTPSWVVKALVDNTLGRLWIQMHPDSSLAPSGPPPLPEERQPGPPVADYLVPRTGEKIRYQRVGDDGKVHTFKRASEITLLDPACGTMHFGQYAFGLFYQMYLDEIANAGKEGWPETPSVASEADIPLAIVENNLFGVDIDARAIQIASLALLLTARESARVHGGDPREVRLRRTNLVVAHGVDLGADRLVALSVELGDRLGEPQLVNRVLARLWESLLDLPELGSLIQVRESVSEAIDAWVEAEATKRGLGKVLRDTSARLGKQLQLGSFVSDTPRKEAEALLERQEELRCEADRLQRELMSSLESLADRVGADPGERLFAEDTARGMALVQVLGRNHDVVVMNPPYGSFIPKSRAFAKEAYRHSGGNIYAAFIERGTQLVEPEGYVGALVSWTFVNLESFEDLRKSLLLVKFPLIVHLNLGLDILDDANVGAAAIVLRGGV